MNIEEATTIVNNYITTLEEDPWGWGVCQYCEIMENGGGHIDHLDDCIVFKAKQLLKEV